MDIDNRNMDIIERLEELRDLMKQKEDWFLLQVAKDEIELLRKERDGLREEVKHLRNMLAMVNLHKNAGYKVKTTGFDAALKEGE